MNKSFCAAVAKQTGEDAIGTAGHYQTYVLIECPYPWAANVFDSVQIPVALRQFVASAGKQRSIQFLCINRGTTECQTGDSVQVLIYDALQVLLPEQSTSELATPEQPVLEKENFPGFLKYYRGFEFCLDSLDQVVGCLRAYWQGHNLGQPITHVQDLLVCTHGMRDKCCARFGQPFFKGAEKMVTQKKLSKVRVWRASHIGGHRFAPTAISLPDGRYYAHLTVAALQTLLTQNGSDQPLSDVLRRQYRGWGRLPKPLQVVERQFFLQFGGCWLDMRLAYRVLSDSDAAMRAALWLQLPDGQVMTYRTEVVRSRHPKHEINTSCNASCPYIPIQYTISELTVVTTHTPIQATTTASR